MTIFEFAAVTEWESRLEKLAALAELGALALSPPALREEPSDSRPLYPAHIPESSGAEPHRLYGSNGLPVATRADY